MIPKEHVLARLYYEIGKQGTNFALQHSRKEPDGEVRWTKRLTFLELDPDEHRWFIEHCNHRQILKNEIILDFDRHIPRETALEDFDVKRIIERLTAEDWRFVVYHNGSKGVHLHIYFDGLMLLSKEDRENFRTNMVDVLRRGLVIGIDKQKCYDNGMIALEHTPHWKSGIEKSTLLNHGVEQWN